ncbi:hypothetical protein EG344_12035 [Chryseobacterium sp. G0162]|nr:hypothetical protein EG344_12035 [Chryseobacterium sp. G0162]
MVIVLKIMKSYFKNITVFRTSLQKKFPKIFQNLSNPCPLFRSIFASEISEKQNITKTNLQN